MKEFFIFETHVQLKHRLHRLSYEIFRSARGADPT